MTIVSEDLTGKTFGRLTVLSRFSADPRRKSRWMCRCTCGNQCIVYPNNLKNGHTGSCGCLGIERRKAALIKHGLTHHYLYKLWLEIRRRCHAPAHNQYADYGGRGIFVFEEWRQPGDFLKFFNYMQSELGERPLRHTLDRVDNNKGYEPGNLRWASARQQANNRRTKRIENFSDSELSAEQWRRLDTSDAFAFVGGC